MIKISLVKTGTYLDNVVRIFDAQGNEFRTGTVTSTDQEELIQSYNWPIFILHPQFSYNLFSNIYEISGNLIQVEKLACGGWNNVIDLWLIVIHTNFFLRDFHLMVSQMFWNRWDAKEIYSSVSLQYGMLMKRLWNNSN